MTAQQALREQIRLIITRRNYKLPNSLVDGIRRIKTNSVHFWISYATCTLLVTFIVSAIFFQPLLLILLANVFMVGAILLHFEEHGQTRRSFWPLVIVLGVFQFLLVYFDVLCTLLLMLWGIVSQLISHAIMFEKQEEEEAVVVNTV